MQGCNAETQSMAGRVRPFCKKVWGVQPKSSYPFGTMEFWITVGLRKSVRICHFCKWKQGATMAGCKIRAGGETQLKPQISPRLLLLLELLLLHLVSL